MHRESGGIVLLETDGSGEVGKGLSICSGTRVRFATQCIRIVIGPDSLSLQFRYRYSHGRRLAVLLAFHQQHL
jgi:hypothetical protein